MFVILYRKECLNVLGVCRNYISLDQGVSNKRSSMMYSMYRNYSRKPVLYYYLNVLYCYLDRKGNVPGLVHRGSPIVACLELQELSVRIRDQQHSNNRSLMMS